MTFSPTFDNDLIPARVQLLLSSVIPNWLSCVSADLYIPVGLTTYSQLAFGLML